jgi:hypothetical protein
VKVNNRVQLLKAAGAFDPKKQASKSPGGLTLEPLRKYVQARDLIGATGNEFVIDPVWVILDQAA